MGNSLDLFANSLSPQVAAVYYGIIFLVILGFLICAYLSEDDRKQYEDDETNYDEDRRYFNQNRGKVKGMI